MSWQSDQFILRSTGRVVVVDHPISVRELQQLIPSERVDLIRHCNDLIHGGRVTSNQIAILQATVENVYAINDTTARSSRSTRRMNLDGRNVRFDDDLDSHYMPAAPEPPQRSSMRPQSSYGYSQSYNPSSYYPEEHRSSRTSSRWQQNYRDAQEYIHAQRAAHHEAASGQRPSRHPDDGYYHPEDSYYHGMEVPSSRRRHRSGRTHRSRRSDPNVRYDYHW